MIGTIRKHSTALWVIVIIVVVIAFVFWGVQSPNPGGGPVLNYGSINGEPVREADFDDARREVLLRYFLSTGELPGADAERRGFDTMRETYSRLLMLQHLEERGIRAGAEAKATVASEVLQSLGRGGQTPTLQQFSESVLQPQGFTLQDFDRFIEHEIGIRQLIAEQGLAGQLITPNQVEAIYQRENREISTQAAFFSASNHLDEVIISDQAVAEAFTNQMALYRIPERMQVRYVAFEATNFMDAAESELARITNLTAMIEAEYEQRGTNAFPGSTAEEAKEQIRQNYLKREALLTARRKAAEFAVQIMEDEPLQVEKFNAAATEQGLEIQVTEPFTREEPPQDSGLPYEAGAAAFRLNEENPFSRPLVGSDAVYVMAYERKVPSEIPPFENVKDQVEERYRFRQAVLLARADGTNFVNALTNQLAAGQSFNAVCTNQGVQPVLLPPLSLSTRSLPQVEQHTSLQQFKQVAFATEPKTASPFIYTADGGYVVYVDEKLPIDEQRMNRELTNYIAYVRQSLQRDVFGAWFQEEAARGLAGTPAAEQEPAEMAAPGEQ